MVFQKIRALDQGYTSEVDTVDEQTWCEILDGFEDANIYQTRPYAAVISGKRNVSHLILRRDGDIVAAAQARIARLPVIPAGIAYILWGPLWRRSGVKDNGDVFRQAIRALRNEFVCKQGLTLRLFPVLFDNDAPYFSGILAEEGLASLASETRSRTILMDLGPSIEDLREGMMAHWKRELKAAARNQLEIVEGTGQELFDTFIAMYREMVSRKRFVEPNDIDQFRLIQAQLPERLKMKILLCKSGGEVCAGVICSAIGKTAVYLFGATSNAGLKSRGSYALHWRLIEQLKWDSVTLYDLNGINPEKNPGTYKFKNDLAGKNSVDVTFLGRFESPGSPLSYLFVQGGEMLRSRYRLAKEAVRTARVGKLWPNLAKSGVDRA
jgi:hypothetical protein